MYFIVHVFQRQFRIDFHKSLEINDEWIRNIRYVDDITNKNDLQQMLDMVNNESIRFEKSIDLKKNETTYVSRIPKNV